MGKMTGLKTFAAAIVLFGALASLSGCSSIYSAARDERTMGQMLDDKTLALTIKKSLADDDTVKALDVSVYAYFGKVFLVGEVDKSVQKSKAIKIAKAQKGTKSVSAYILSKDGGSMGKTVDDVGITAKVKAKMIADKKFSATQVDVTTVRGNVVLLGVVGSAKDRNKAIAHAKSVKYVKSVKSFLIVK